MMWVADLAWPDWVLAAVGMVGFWGVVLWAVTAIVMDARTGGLDTEKTLSLDTPSPGVAPGRLMRSVRLGGRLMTASVR